MPGGEKALVISKFDALSQKIEKLIPTLQLYLLSNLSLWFLARSAPKAQFQARVHPEVRCGSFGRVSDPPPKRWGSNWNMSEWQGASSRWPINLRQHTNEVRLGVRSFHSQLPTPCFQVV